MAEGDGSGKMEDMMPDEMLSAIISRLPCVVRVATCQLVCQRWRRVVLDDAAIGRKPCARPSSYDFAWPERWAVRSCDHAARWGHVDCLRYARAKGDPWGASLCMQAAYNGHADALGWLLDQGCPHDPRGDRVTTYGYGPTDLATAAIYGASIGCVERVLSHGIPLPQNACVVAARAGNVGMLRHLHAKAYRWDDDVCKAAAAWRKLDCLKYAHASGLSVAACDLQAAIQHGSDAVVGYAVQNGRMPTREELWMAINLCRTQCVIHMLDAGVPFGGREWEYALLSDHTDMIELGLESGWTPTRADMLMAIRKNCGTTVMHLVRGRDFGLAMVETRSLYAVRWMQRHYRYYWHERLCEAAVAADDCNVLRYLHENGCPWDWHACMAKARSRRHSCYRYLRKHFLILDAPHTLDCANAGK